MLPQVPELAVRSTFHWRAWLSFLLIAAAQNEKKRKPDLQIQKYPAERLPTKIRLVEPTKRKGNPVFFMAPPHSQEQSTQQQLERARRYRVGRGNPFRGILLIGASTEAR